jgi:hypothetical protein
VRLEGLRQLENPVPGNRTRDLPVCGIVPQPRIMLPIYCDSLSIFLLTHAVQKLFAIP